MAWNNGFDLNQGGMPALTPMDLNFTALANSPAAAPAPATPQTGGLSSLLGQLGGTGGSSGLLGLSQLGFSGLGTLGNLWTAMGALNLAKQQFGFQKSFANANLANQTQSYNTALTDKANARYFTEGKPQAEADSYIKSNSLPNRTV